MTTNPFSFEDLIYPIKKSDFFKIYWEKKPLLITKRSKGYKDLLSSKDFDFLLTTLPHFPASRWVKFVNNTEHVDISKFLSKVAHRDNGPISLNRQVIDLAKVEADFNEGTTVVLNSLEYRSDPVRKLCYMLQETLGHSVEANCYLTPPSAQGFNVHYDSHDVFVLQLEGEKLWKIYKNPAPNPISNKIFNDPEKPGPLLHEIILKPGDLLYLPRGYIHVAETGKTISLHMSVGVYSFIWLDLIKELTLQSSVMRKSLPVGQLLDKLDNHVDEDVILEMQKLFKDKKAIKQAFDKLRQIFSASKTPPVS